MTENHELLQRIMMEPHNDAPRLRYADWLEETCDHDRAEFIRIQCSLNSESPNVESKSKLERREHELLQRYAWDWAEEFGQDIYEWQFERGFVTRIQTLLERPAAEILNIVNRGPVTHLRDPHQGCDLQGFVDALPQLGRLTGLEFWNLYAFEDDLLAQMLQSPHLANLRTLILHHDRNGNLVNEQVIIEGLHSPHRANLEQLAVNVDCSWRGPTNAIIDAIATSPHLRNLRRLDLSNAGDAGNDPQLQVETIRRLSASPNMEHLEVLDLRAVHATKAVWNAILEMPLLKRLKKLYLAEAAEIPEGHWIPIVGYVEKISRWREAFDNCVAEIDWETRFIDPYDELADYWKGHTWSERRRAAIFGIQDFVNRSDFGNLERHYRQLCQKHASDEVTQSVDNIRFDTWVDSLREPLMAAAEFAESRGSTSIVLRTRSDAGWQTNVCVHDEYGPKVSDSDEDSFEPFEEYSYFTPAHETKAGECEAAARLLSNSSVEASLAQSCAAAYIVARSVAALGRLAKSLPIRQRLFCNIMWSVFRFR